MDTVLCACGCGTPIPAINTNGKPARYAKHHFRGGGRPPGKPAWNKGIPNPRSREVHAGKKLSAEEIARRTATRIANNGGVYQQKKGWKHTEETRAKMRDVNKRKALRGPDNPFYGKTHSPETRAKMGARGDKHPCWNGGTATLPYGPEFTRKYKRLLRERDNNTCQRCGKTREEVGRTLEIHHIDHDKANNDPTNLVTVCHSCNMWHSWNRDAPFVRFDD